MPARPGAGPLRWPARHWRTARRRLSRLPVRAENSWEYRRIHGELAGLGMPDCSATTGRSVAARAWFKGCRAGWTAPQQVGGQLRAAEDRDVLAGLLLDPRTRNHRPEPVDTGLLVQR